MIITPEELDELEQVKDVSPMERLRQSAKVWNALPALIATARRAIELEAQCLAKDARIYQLEMDLHAFSNTLGGPNAR